MKIVVKKQKKNKIYENPKKISTNIPLRHYLLSDLQHILYNQFHKKEWNMTNNIDDMVYG